MDYAVGLLLHIVTKLLLASLVLFVCCHCRVYYELHRWFDHFLPAWMMDLCLSVVGKRPMLVSFACYILICLAFVRFSHVLSLLFVAGQSFFLTKR